MNSSDELKDARLELAPGVALYRRDDRGGYIATPSEVLRVNGSDFAAFVVDPLPDLLEGKPLSSLLPSDSDRFARVNKVLSTLVARDFLRPVVEKPAQSLNVCIVASPTLRDSIRGTALFSRDAPLLEPHELKEWGVRTDATNRLAVAVTDRSQDPMLFQVNSIAMRMGIPVLYAGFDGALGAWVGPLWKPGCCQPCFECFTTRVNLNHDQGALRSEFASFLRTTEQCPPTLPSSAQERLLLIQKVVEEVDRFDADRRATELSRHTLWLRPGSENPELSPVLPVPQCASCGSSQERELDAIENTLDMMTDAVHPRTGVLFSDSSVEMGEQDPPIFCHFAHFRDLRLLPSHLGPCGHGGAGLDPTSARAAAIGESLERYAASIWKDNELRLSSYDDFKGSAVHPDNFELFSDAQYASEGFRFRPLRPATPVRWVRAIECATGNEAWVPAALVFMPYKRIAAEPMIFPSVTSGLAAGPSLAHAILAGLCEVVERDAISASWFYKISPRRWTAEMTDWQSSLREHYPEDEFTSYRRYDISLDLPLPVALTVAKTTACGADQIQIGSACRVRPELAVAKATLEAAQSFPYQRSLMKLYADWDPGPSFDGVDSFQKHGLLYTKFPEHRQRVGYILAPQGVPPESLREPARHEMPSLDATPQENLEYAVSVLTKAGFNPLFVDLTTPDLRHMGVHVVRALVPGLLQLSGTHRVPILGRRRLAHIRQWLGLDDVPLNTMPHPLP